MIQAGSYLASESGIDLSTKLSGKAFKAGEGFTILEASGSGKVLVASYGAIFEKVLQTGEEYIVDSSHLVAFDASLGVQTLTVGGFKSTLLSGEGLVCQTQRTGENLHSDPFSQGSDQLDHPPDSHFKQWFIIFFAFSTGTEIYLCLCFCLLNPHLLGINRS